MEIPRSIEEVVYKFRTKILVFQSEIFLQKIKI